MSKRTEVNLYRLTVKVGNMKNPLTLSFTSPAAYRDTINLVTFQYGADKILDRSEALMVHGSAKAAMEDIAFWAN